MDSRNQSETAFEKTRPVPAVTCDSPKAAPVKSNYPAKTPFASSVLPSSHRPTSA